MTPGNKSFDAVQMMRSIRDELNEQIKSMTFEHEHSLFPGARQQLDLTSLTRYNPSHAAYLFDL